MIRVGVIGFGFMGQTHVRAYQLAASQGLPVALAAVADLSGAALTGRAFAKGNIDTGTAEQVFDPGAVRTYPTAEALLSDSDLDLVSVCTPTDTHARVAKAALRAGRHVLLEKPVATTHAGVLDLLDAERASSRRVMPAMCMRFWPGWTWLREAVNDRRFGTLVSLRLTRLGSRPDWSEFYRDAARSGDAICDLHIHDVDFLSHLLGTPSRVLSVGTTSHVTTTCLFDAGPWRDLTVIAEGGWLPSAGRGFRMRYVAEFERATAEFDLGRSPVLCVTAADATRPVEIPAGTGYEGEIRAAIQWLASGGSADPPVTLEEAAEVLRVVEAERRSLGSREIEAV